MSHTQNMAATPDDDAGSEQSDSTPALARFETSVAELETLVENLESGDLTLEQALTRFERGITLSRECQTLLKNAELRVDQLLADGDDEHVAAFDSGENTTAG